MLDGDVIVRSIGVSYQELYGILTLTTRSFLIIELGYYLFSVLYKVTTII